jgi:uncharacterized iron-regulated membrane protein
MTALGMRPLAILIHRYVGLAMAVFLLVAGLTGSLLVFYTELDRLASGSLQLVDPPHPDAPLLEPFELAERIQAALPGAGDSVFFDLKPRAAVSVWLEVEPEEWREAFVDPYTGRVLGQRNWGDLSEGWINLMPFLFQLHYALALGDVGVLLFGIVALLWTVDCFVGVYLTFPLPERRASVRPSVWLRRWAPAWLVRSSRLFSFVFTFHRASGLWAWILLLVFAWSAVGMNLSDVYRPVMNATFGMTEPVHDTLPELGRPHPKAQFSLREAHGIGRKLMAKEAGARGFRILGEDHLYHAAEHDAFVYGVLSSLDISKKYPRTEVYFSAKDGHLLGFDAATGLAAGNTITNWLYGLHFAAVWGLWYQIVVVLMGLLVAVLSVTGVWVWWVKRQKRARAVSAPEFVRS